MKKFLLLNLVLIFFLNTLQVNSQEQTQDKKNFNPKPASASIYNLGLKSYENRDLESAISFFKQAIELDPNFVDAYYNLGVIYKKQNDFPLAIHSFQKAYNIDSQDYETAFELGSSYLAQNEYDNAKKYFSLIPNNSSKYLQAKQNLEKINSDLTNSPDSQGQLLIDTLAKVQDLPGTNEQSNNKPATVTTPEGKILVEVLDKEQMLKSEIKTVKNDFSGPTGITKDSQNNIYVANFKNDTIEKISQEGKREIFFVKGGIKGPVGLAIDGNDNIYVANYAGNSILKITQDKKATIVKDNIEKPYYLYYDAFSNKLFVTVQGNDSLVEINTFPVSQPITSN